MRRVVPLAAALTVVTALGVTPAGAAAARRAASSPSYKATVTTAIVDIQKFWSREFPKVYGKRYKPVPSDRIFAARPGVKLPKCSNEDSGRYSEVKGNAFYCQGGNFVAYDDADLFPSSAKAFGVFTPAVYLAHEWGHAVQDRAGNRHQETVLKEQQADCFAGAWAKHVQKDKPSGLHLGPGVLDHAVAALLDLHDAVGASPDDPRAHGSGFDRVRAFQEGFESGAAKCATYFDSPPVLTEIPFTSEQDAAENGNLPAEQVIPVTVDLLNDFYGQVEPAYQPKTLDEVKKYDSSGSTDQLPQCGGTTPKRSVLKNRVFYCIDDHYFAFDEPYVQHVYDDIGDFGVATLLANTWATYVQTLQKFPGVADNADNAVLGADCYTGGFTAAIFNKKLSSATAGGEVDLSPGDLDETVKAFIDYAAARGVSQSINVTFVRLHAFRDGFFNGYQTCQKDYANSSATFG